MDTIEEDDYWELLHDNIREPEWKKACRDHQHAWEAGTISSRQYVWLGRNTVYKLLQRGHLLDRMPPRIKQCVLDYWQSPDVTAREISKLSSSVVNQLDLALHIASGNLTEEKLLLPSMHRPQPVIACHTSGSTDDAEDSLLSGADWSALPLLVKLEVRMHLLAMKAREAQALSDLQTQSAREIGALIKSLNSAGRAT